MGMAAGGGGGVRSEINVTPLVDVVLVLLIIFMVVTPLLQMGYDVNVPPKDPNAENMAPQPPPPDQLIIRMDRDGKVFINKEQIALQDFPFRLSQQTQGRGAKMIFFSADGELPYHQVSEFMDLCYNNGATNLGIVLEDIDLDADAGAAAAGP